MLTFACGLTSKSYAQTKLNTDATISCIGFYNLENLFDTINDPRKNDNDFLPNGKYAWDSEKYTSKLAHMSYVISQMGINTSPKGPAVIGLCEVENRQVLEDLVKQKSIAERNYQIVHHEGPDRRGIDCALIFNPDYFTVSNSKSVRYMTKDKNYRTRDQLVVSGKLQGEAVHFIVIHWPSRWGGEEKSRPKRIGAAKTTLAICDSLYSIDKNAKIIIMGDFNDDPHDYSCTKILKAKKDKADVKKQGFYNPLWTSLDNGAGSLFYRGKWNLFDMIIISEPLAKASKKELGYRSAEVFNKDFLIQQEGKYKGYMFRTSAGGKWLNGYSDHLPVLMYLEKKK